MNKSTYRICEVCKGRGVLKKGDKVVSCHGCGGSGIIPLRNI